MKKIFSLIAALAFVATASAQVISTYDFEDGKAPEKWGVWMNKTNSVTDKAKDGKYALEVKVGTYFNFNVPEPKTTYKVSMDINHIWGPDPASIVVAFYNPKTKKLEELKRVEISSEKGYKHYPIEFKTKVQGYHRVTIATGKSGSDILVDNVKVEKLK